MGDLDVCLIKEFACRPGFYDRGDPNFKDKEYAAQNWLEISHQLGYEAALLKDRMYQLRNRYNLEKRRLETMRLEDPNKQIRSPWPLFYHLAFLDRHIRPRRSYKSMMRRPADIDSSIYEDDSIMTSERYGRNNTSRRRNGQQNNGNIDIKYEAEIDSDDAQQNGGENGAFLDPSNFLADEGDSNDASPTHNGTVNGGEHNTRNGSAGMQGRGIHVRSLDSMKRISSNTSEDFQQQPLAKRFKASNHTLAVGLNAGGFVDKFTAFGQFIAASLADMNDKKALELIGKFTGEVVKALGEKEIQE